MVARRLLLKSTLLLPLASEGSQSSTKTVEGSWLDISRQRSLPWRLRLPSGDLPCPLVIYSHGLGGSRESGQAWGSAWADSGIAVLHLQHPGSDIDALRNGARAKQAAASADQFIERLLDVRFAISEALRRAAADDVPWSRINADAIGVAGHSYGALTTQAIAGQRYPQVDGLSDPRPRAFVALSPSLPIGVKMSSREAFAGVVRPFFALTGSLDFSPFPGTQPSAQRAAVYDALPPGQRALLWLAGANHQTFGGTGTSLRETDAQRTQRPVHPTDRHDRLIASATTLWWQWRLADDYQARLRLESLEDMSRDDKLQLG